jgi:hypothetical protein
MWLACAGYVQYILWVTNGGIHECIMELIVQRIEATSKDFSLHLLRLLPLRLNLHYIQASRYDNCIVYIEFFGTYRTITYLDYE